MANSYKLKYRSGSSYVTYCPFPVDSIFMSWSTVNPSTYWPGTSSYGDDGSWQTTAAGGGQAHENRPLSYAVSMWRRTA